MGSTRARAVGPAPPRKLAFRWSPFDVRGMKRRKAQLCSQWRVPSAACDSDLRCAHAFRRSIAAFLFPGPCFRVLGTGIVPVIRPAFASLHPHPSSRKRQSPVVGPDGYPGPPESVLARHVRGRHTLSHLQRRPREAPLVGQGWRNISLDWRRVNQGVEVSTLQRRSEDLAPHPTGLTAGHPWRTNSFARPHASAGEGKERASTLSCRGS